MEAFDPYTVVLLVVTVNHLRACDPVVQEYGLP